MSDSFVLEHPLQHSDLYRTLDISIRNPTNGPEFDLVRDYMHRYLPPPPRGQARTIFVEPRIASGFPDIVVVYWHVATTEKWHSNRANLRRPDVRVLHFLVSRGVDGVSSEELGVGKQSSPAIRRLIEAGLVIERSHHYYASPLKRIFAVRRLIAIEAKIKEWKAGLAQALQNTWFASESYLLLKRLPNRNSLFDEAARFGLGILLGDQPMDKPVAPARTEQLPKSYVSWMFNEWVWRAALMHDNMQQGARRHDD